jgi:hypothetical protein
LISSIQPIQKKIKRKKNNIMSVASSPNFACSPHFDYRQIEQQYKKNLVEQNLTVTYNKVTSFLPDESIISNDQSNTKNEEVIYLQK